MTVEEGAVAVPTAGAWGQQPVRDDGRCGRCTNCTADIRDAQEVARLNREASGFGAAELIGGPRPCLRQQERVRAGALMDAGG